jgi:hypothetical protein
MEKGREPEDEKLVNKALDESRLISGENPESREPAEVSHWIDVYRELLGFKSQILADMTQTMPKMNPEAASEVGEIDLTLLERQAEKYRTRLSFWEERARELAAGQPAKGEG